MKTDELLQSLFDAVIRYRLVGGPPVPSDAPGRVRSVRVTALSSYRPSGFTMVELIVVIMIVGITAAVVAPRMGLLQGFDEIGYRDQVKATLEYARKSAVAQRRSVRVATAGNGLTLTVETCHPEGSPASTPPCPVAIALGSYPRSLDLPAADSSCGGATNQICAPANTTLAGPTPLDFSPAGSPSGTPNCVAPSSPANFCYTISGSFIIEVEATTGYVH